MVIAPESLASLSAKELREMVTGLMARITEHDRQITQRDAQIGQLDETIASKDRESKYRQAKIDQLTHEMAVLKCWKFGRNREQLDSAPASLLDEAIDADIAAIELELEQLAPVPPADAAPRQQPRRSALPPELPRVEMHHEPESSSCTTPGCGCKLKRIGEDVSEKLDYTPGLFTVERHIRGKWTCIENQTLIQAPVPAQIIDKGIPTAGLLAQVLVAKYADHLPLHRQEGIFARAGLELPRSTLSAWVGSAGFICSRWSMP